MNSVFLQAQLDYENEIEKNKGALEDLDRQRKVIMDARKKARENMFKAFLENFTGSDEEVEFMLDYSKSGGSDEIYYFHKKYFAQKGIISENLHAETNQIALKLKMADMNEQQIHKLADYILEQGLNVVKPINQEANFDGKKISGYKLFHIYPYGLFDQEHFSGDVFLIEKDGLYTVSDSSRYGNNVVVIKWNNDLHQTLVDAKNILHNEFGCEEED